MTESIQAIKDNSRTSSSHMMTRRAANQEKIKKEEEELKRLLAQSKGQKAEEEEEQEPEAEAAEQEQEQEAEQEQEPKQEEEEEDTGNWKKRYGDLRRHTDKQLKELREQMEELKTAKPEEKPESRAQLEQWMEKNPKTADIVRSIARDQAAEMVSGIDEKFAEIEQKEQKLEIKSAMQKVSDVHPDFDKLKEADEFHDWLEDQPKVVQDMMYANATDYKSAIKVVTMYKTENGIKMKKRPAAVEKVGNSRRTVADTPTGEDIVYSDEWVQNASLEEFTEHQEKIQEARRKGTYIYNGRAAAAR